MGTIDAYKPALIILMAVVLAATAWAVTRPTLAEWRRPAVIIVIAAAIMSALVSTATASAAPAAPAPQFTAGEKLKDPSKLLLEPGEFAAITGADSALARQVLGPDTTLFDTASRLDTPSCASVYGPAEKSSYAGSRYRDLVVTALSDGAGNAASQALVRFPDLRHLSAYAKDLKQQWDACANRVLTYTGPDGQPQRFDLGEPTLTDNKVLVMSARSANGVLCQRAVGAVGAIFIDVAVCSLDDESLGETTVLAIAGKTNLREV